MAVVPRAVYRITVDNVWSAARLQEEEVKERNSVCANVSGLFVEKVSGP